MSVVLPVNQDKKRFTIHKATSMNQVLGNSYAGTIMNSVEISGSH